MMATSDNGIEPSNDIDIDSLIIPDVNESDVSAVVNSLHQELTAGSTVTQESQVNDGATQALVQTTSTTIDLTKTVKTEGEASNVSKPPPPSSQLTLNLSSTNTAESNRRQSLSLMSPFGRITPQTPLTPNSQVITPEEQAAVHKQAGLLAIHTYCAKHGAGKAKEILDGVTKVKNFLTNLIQLASKSGNQVHSSVHSLVQKLVGATISEDEFAKKIEEVLQSKHQPNLLPFLKTSIPDLRQHILLQKGIMKQLIEKKVQEKKSQEAGGVATSSVTAITSSHQSTPEPHQSTPPPATPQLPETTKPLLITTNNSSTHNTVSLPAATPTSLSATPSPLPSLPAATPSPLPSLSLSAQQQQVLRDHLSKLSEPQQKIYLERIKKEFEKQRQQLILQQKQLLNKQRVVAISSVVGATPTTTPIMTSQQKQQLSTLLKQNELIRQQQQQTTLSLGGGGSGSTSHIIGSASSPNKKGGGGSATGLSRKPLSSLLLKKSDKEDGPSPSKATKNQENEDEEEEGMDIAGVNLKEESANFLPSVSDTVTRSVTDHTFVDKTSLRGRVLMTARLHGINDVSDDAITLFSHALEERLRNVMDKLTMVNQHRAENLKDDSHYQVTSDVRGQLKVLGKIDQISASRREEKEKEMIFKAAKSRSKQDDPELAKKKEQAKQIQLAQEREIHQKAANETALAAIGRRKRTATAAFGESSSSGSSTATADNEQTLNSSSSSLSTFFNTPGPSSRTKQKRKIQAKDVLFVMEQEKETRKSLLLYKSLLN